MIICIVIIHHTFIFHSEFGIVCANIEFLYKKKNKSSCLHCVIEIQIVHSLLFRGQFSIRSASIFIVHKLKQENKNFFYFINR